MTFCLARAEIERTFTALGKRLVRPGVVADVFVVGGAAMALAYDAARVTRDVDAVFKPHAIVLEEVRKVADDLGLPYWWLNDQASVYISGKEDASKRRYSIIRIARDGGVAGACLRDEAMRRQDARHR
jgi:hypothetical protein